MVYAEKGEVTADYGLVKYTCRKCGGSFEAIPGGTGYCYHYGTRWDTRGKSVMPSTMKQDRPQPTEQPKRGRE